MPTWDKVVVASALIVAASAVAIGIAKWGRTPHVAEISELERAGDRMAGRHHVGTRRSQDQPRAQETESAMSDVMSHLGVPDATPENGVLETIRRDEVERFTERLRTDDISALEMRYWDEWLKLCLADEQGRQAFEEWVLKRAKERPDDVALLQEAMASLERCTPEVLEDIIEQAIADENWLALGAAMRFDPEQHSASWAQEAIEAGIASDNNVAQFYALRQLGKLDTLSPEDCERLLEPVFFDGDDDIGVEITTMHALGAQGLLGTEEHFEVLEGEFLSSDDPARRSAGYTGLVLALAKYWAGDGTYELPVILERVDVILDYTAQALRDPDPLVRLEATLSYRSLQRDIALFRSGAALDEE